MARQGDLRKLDELSDFTVASGDPDPRGWTVKSSDGRDIGRVSDLVVDTDAMKARYLDVELDRDLAPTAVDRHVLVPAESVSIGDRERREKRLSLPITQEFVRSASVGEDPSRGEWPAAEYDPCNVRITRGEGNG